MVEEKEERFINKINFLDNANLSAENLKEGTIEIVLPLRLIYLNKQISETINNLNFSILEGEYIFASSKEKIKQFLIKTKTIKTEFNTRIRNNINPELENIVKLINSSYEQLISIFNYYQKLISSFNEHLDSHFETNEKFYFIEESSRIFKNSEIDEIAQLISKNDNNQNDLNLNVAFFKTNVLLAELDSKIECSESFLRTLLRVYHSFNIHKKSDTDSLIETPIYKILSEKCLYLIYKVMKRLEVEFIYDEDLNLEDSKLSIKDINNKIIFFKDFFTQTEKNYSGINIKLSNHLNDIENNFKNCTTNDSQRIANYHWNAKVAYKQCQNYDQSNILLIQCFEKSKQLELPSKNSDANLIRFNEIAIANISFLILKNKLKNTVTKIKNELQETTIDKNKLNQLKDEIIKEYKEINNFLKDARKTNSYQINDYYHHYLFTKIVYYFTQTCLLNNDNDFVDICKELLKETGIEFSNKFNDSIKSDESVFTKIEQNIKISNAINYLPVYLTYDECKIKFNIDNADYPIKNLFLDSSYILPINFHKQTNIIKELKNDYYLLNSLLSRVEMFNNKMKTFNKEISNKINEDFDKAFNSVSNKLEEKAKESNIGGIQILGIFTSVLAIIVIFTNIIPKIDDILLSVIYMIGFSLSLGIFLLSLNHIVNYKSQEKVFNSRFWNTIFPNKIYIYFLLLTILLITLIYNYSKKGNNTKLRTNSKTVSIYITDTNLIKNKYLKKDTSSKN